MTIHDNTQLLSKEASVTLLSDMLKQAEEEKRVLRKALEAAKRQHLIVDDCWYSCPLAKRDHSEDSASCNDAEIARGECTCGADAHNAAIDAALAPVGS